MIQKAVVVSIFSILLLHPIAFAQNPFIKTFCDTTNSNSGQSILLTLDSGIIIVGSKDTCALLIKTDRNGDTLWTSYFNGGVWTMGTSVVETSDSGYMVFGSIRNNGQGYSDAYLAKLDNSGHFMWSKSLSRYSIGDYSIGNSIIQAVDSGYVLTGRTTNSSGFDIFLAKVDDNGSLVWSKRLGDANNSSECSALCKTFDGGYALTGLIYNASTHIGSALLIKTNGYGDTLWVKHFQVPGWPGYFMYSIVQDFDSGYVLAGNINASGPGGALDLSIMKTDSQGNLLWAKRYGGANSDRAYSIKQTSDSMFVIVGMSNSFGSGDWDIYMLKINGSGDTLFTKRIGNALDEMGYSLVKMSDQSLLITGLIGRAVQGKCKVLLVKTDSSGTSGCLESRTSTTVSPLFPVTISNSLPISFYGVLSNTTSHFYSGISTATFCSNVGLQEMARSETKIQVFPNPARNLITFRSYNFPKHPVVEIYDVYGKLLLTESFLGNDAIVDLTALANGLYVYKLVGQQIFQSGKFILFK